MESLDVPQTVVAWTGGVEFPRTLNYFSNTARIKCFDQRIATGRPPNVASRRGRAKETPQPTFSNGWGLPRRFHSV